MRRIEGMWRTIAKLMNFTHLDADQKVTKELQGYIQTHTIKNFRDFWVLCQLLEMKQPDQMQYLNHPTFKKEAKLQPSLFGRLLQSYHEDVDKMGLHNHQIMYDTYDLNSNLLTRKEIEAGYVHTLRSEDDKRPTPEEKEYLETFDLRDQLLEASDMRENVLMRTSIIGLESVVLCHDGQELEEVDEALEYEEQHHDDNDDGIQVRNTEVISNLSAVHMIPVETQSKVLSLSQPVNLSSKLDTLREDLTEHAPPKKQQKQSE
jgi:hypothetical protein